MFAIKRAAILAGAICAAVACAGRGDEPKEAPKYGLDEGLLMPFHVADFVNSKSGHCGCPSVMISNSKAPGMIVWSRGAGAGVLRLAAALDGLNVEDARLKRFLVAYDADQEELKKDAADIRHVIVGRARSSAKTALDDRGVDEATKIVVFFLDQKLIKKKLVFAKDSLSDDEFREIMTAAKEHAGEK